VASRRGEPPIEASTDLPEVVAREIPVATEIAAATSANSEKKVVTWSTLIVGSAY